MEKINLLLLKEVLQSIEITLEKYQQKNDGVNPRVVSYNILKELILEQIAFQNGVSHEITFYTVSSQR